MINDILISVQNVLKAALSSIKATHTIRNCERIADIRNIAVKYSFPAIGILDGGERTQGGATAKLVTEIVNLAIYVDVLGDQEKSMDEAREIVNNAVAELRKKDHYRTGGAFAGYSRAFCPQKSEMKKVYTADDLNPLLLKLIRIEFTTQEVNT